MSGPAKAGDDIINKSAFDAALSEVRSKFSDISPEEFELLIEEACDAARVRRP